MIVWRTAFASAACALLAACTGSGDAGKKFDAHRAAAIEPQFRRESSSQQIQAEWLRPPASKYKLGPGDKITIEMLGGDGAKDTALVTADGRIYFDLLSGTQVGGLTTEEARKLLEEKLKQYYRDPRVNLTVANASSQRVWVLGRVNKPGVYPITRPTTLVDAISQAGGLYAARFSGSTQELADLDHSFIMRNGQPLPVDFGRLLRNGDMGQNIYVQPGDFIYLPSSLSQEVHVLGAVKEARTVGFSEDMSLAGVLSAAHGPLESADLQRIVIVRGSLTHPQTAVVDFAAIQQGKAANVRLAPRDIIYVPERATGPVSKVVDLVLSTFTRTVAANEGNRAAVPASQPVQPSLGIGQ